MNRALRMMAYVCMGAAITGAKAADHVWITVPGGNWNVAANWSPATVPVAGERVDVGKLHSGCTAIVTDARAMQDLYVGLDSEGTVDIQATGDLDVSQYCVIGFGNTAGTAGIGTIRVAGRLSAPTVYFGHKNQIGDEASGIVQSGGAVTSTAVCYMGNAAGTRSYFDQNGGANYFQVLALGRQNGTRAVYTITNGSMTAATLNVGDVGIGATGLLTVAGSATVMTTSALVIGNGGASQVNHVIVNGGTLNASQILMGQGGVGRVCDLNVSGGTLTTPVINVGNSSVAGLHRISQTGGTLNCPLIRLPYAAGATSRYAMAGGRLNGGDMYFVLNQSATLTTAASVDISGGTMSLTNMYMGWGGAGTVCTVNQTGGTNRIVTALQMGVNSGSHNAYTVSGGLLDAGAIYVGGNYVSTTTGMLAYAGGEIRVNTLTFKAAPKVVGLRLTVPWTGLNPIAVANTATLDGTLSVERATNYSFTPGTVITAMTYSVRSGAFAQTNLLGGMSCRVNYDVDVGGGRKAITLDLLRPLPLGSVVCIR